MTEKIREQIMAIRESGVTNMIDINRVQVAANERGFYELVVFIEENRKAYVHFIFFGDDAS